MKKLLTFALVLASSLAGRAQTNIAIDPSSTAPAHRVGSSSANWDTIDSSLGGAADEFRFNPGVFQYSNIYAQAIAGGTTFFTVSDVFDSSDADFWAGGNFQILSNGQNPGSQVGCNVTIAHNTITSYQPSIFVQGITLLGSKGGGHDPPVFSDLTVVSGNAPGSSPLTASGEHLSLFTNDSSGTPYTLATAIAGINAAALSTSNLGAITASLAPTNYTVVSGGSNFTRAPSITVSGSGGGSRAQLFAVLTGGSISSVTVGRNGDSFSGTITVTVGTDGGGSGASITASLLPSTNTLTAAGAAPFNQYMQITLASPCAAATQIGDVAVMRSVLQIPSQALWESNNGYNPVKVNSGHLYSEQSDLPTSIDAAYQNALVLDATAGSSAQAGITRVTDGGISGTENVFKCHNGQYDAEIIYKVATGGTGALTFSAIRDNHAANASAMNATVTPTLTADGAWHDQIFTVGTFAEACNTFTASPDFKSQYTIKANGSSKVYLAKVTFVKHAASRTYPQSTFSDEYIRGLQTLYASTVPGPPATHRRWLFENGATFATLTGNDYSKLLTGAGQSPPYPGTNGNDWCNELYLDTLVGADPYLVIPMTISPADMSSLITWLTTGTPCSGVVPQTQPWKAYFKKIYLEPGNENWNTQAEDGQGLGQRANAPHDGQVFDYAYYAATLIAASRANPNYDYTKIQWQANLQLGAVGSTLTTVLGTSLADGGEEAPYMFGGSTNTEGNAALENAQLAYPYCDSLSPCPVFGNVLASVQAVQGMTCGSTGHTHSCFFTTYEQNINNGFSNAVQDQSTLNAITRGGIMGIMNPLQQMLAQNTSGYNVQNSFGDFQPYTTSQYGVPTSIQLKPLMWGIIVDCGGAESLTLGAPCTGGPSYYGQALFNAGILDNKIGSTVSSGQVTRNQVADSLNGPVPAISNVPMITPACYANAAGTSFSCTVINSDITSAHTVTFSGTNAPTTGVTIRQLGCAWNALNEAGSNSTSNTVSPSCLPAAPITGVSVSGGYSVPALSLVAFDWTVGGTPTASTPTFSPVAGTYSASQSVTISCSTGPTACENTTGSPATNHGTGCTTGTLVTGPVSVPISQTLYAACGGTGFLDALGSAVYVISLPTAATPTFSPAAGSYGPPQTVTISDATSGAAIHYTTDGSTPTSGSALYSGPIMVSTSQTVSAIAIKSGFTNSAVGTAAYVINGAAATPSLSPAAGSYSSAQTITITDSTSGAAIYYTTNGSTPTTSSTFYSGPFVVSVTGTVKAIAAASGYSNSAIASSLYTITGSGAPAPLSITGGPLAITGGPLNITLH